jgi:broad specificity phosphatase PhoE
MRARESADIINETVHTQIEILDGLRERSYGILGGLTKTEALEMYREAVEAHNDPANTDPEGESQADFTKRVVSTLSTIKGSGHTCVVVVSHGGSIKTILHHLNMSVPDMIGDGEIIEIEM